MFGDSVTTDHISPAGSIKDTSPAGKYLLAHGVLKADFNSYGPRRGNHEVMMRGTFANVRIKNLMIPPKADGSRVEGGLTLHQPTGEQMSIYDAAMKYIAEGTPTVVIGGEEYGTGSSRDWAAKGTQLLGVKAVVARSFERIHRSNLVGMGVLPLQFKGSDSAQSLGIIGNETFDVEGIEGDLKPQQDVVLVIHRANGDTQRVPVLLRIDTPIEVDYYNHGGILPFVLRQLAGRVSGPGPGQARPGHAEVTTAHPTVRRFFIGGRRAAGPACGLSPIRRVSSTQGCAARLAPTQFGVHPYKRGAATARPRTDWRHHGQDPHRFHRRRRRRPVSADEGWRRRLHGRRAARRRDPRPGRRRRLRSPRAEIRRNAARRGVWSTQRVEYRFT